MCLKFDATVVFRVTKKNQPQSDLLVIQEKLIWGFVIVLPTILWKKCRNLGFAKLIVEKRKCCFFWHFVPNILWSKYRY